jgi:hypothetical protein
MDFFELFFQMEYDLLSREVLNVAILLAGSPPVVIKASFAYPEVLRSKVE